MLLSCPNVDLRDPARSVTIAQKCCKISNWKDWQRLTMLAAAHAQNGNFVDAADWQEQAIRLAPEKAHDKLDANLARFQEGQPLYR